MEEQRQFAKILHPNGHGIALRYETPDINVGDICYWDDAGKATRILNIFENKSWLQANNWPVLNLTKDQALEKPEALSLQIVHSSGVYYGFTSNSVSPGFDVFFERTGSSNTAAIIMPSSPTTSHGLRSAARHHIEQWWALAKRYAFRTWPYLLNAPTGIFLVTKTIKTTKYSCGLSKGNPGERSVIHINGSVRYPHNQNDLNIPSQGTHWQPVVNQLSMELHDSQGKVYFTIFMEREASRMYNLADPSLKDAAHKLWGLCTQTSQSQSANWANTPPGWNSRPSLTSTWPPPAISPSRPINPAVSWAVFDGKDRITLKDGWFLIHGGDGEFFLEHASSGLDLSPNRISVSSLWKVLKGPNAPSTPPQTAPAVNPPMPPPPIVYPPAAPAPPVNIPPPQINHPPAAPISMPPIPQMQPLPGMAQPNSYQQQIEQMRRGLEEIRQQQQMQQMHQHQQQQQQQQQQQRPQPPLIHLPTPAPINSPSPPIAHPPPIGAGMPGIASISPPLTGIPHHPPALLPPSGPGPLSGGIPNVVMANPLPEPRLPESNGSGGSRSVLPNYAGFKFSGNSVTMGGAPVVHIKPPEGLQVPIPWGWNG